MPRAAFHVPHSNGESGRSIFGAVKYKRTPEQVFDDWARDYHAAGMEEGHWPAVREAFELIPESDGFYLEVGVGNGYGLYHMATNQYVKGSCLGIDISENMVAVTRNRIEGLPNASVRRTGFLDYRPEDHAPDLIFSMEVFYYLSEIQDGIDHAMDILEPGGRLMILVNHYEERIDSHDWPVQLDTPMTLWSAADYAAGMRKAGFEEVTQSYFNVPDDPEKRRENPGTLGTWGVKPG